MVYVNTKQATVNKDPLFMNPHITEIRKALYTTNQEVLML